MDFVALSVAFAAGAAFWQFKSWLWSHGVTALKNAIRPKAGK